MKTGIFAVIALTLAAMMAQADEGKLSIELNKFETGEAGGCRAFFLFRNQTGNSFEEFEMSLAILDGDGVIDRLLSIDAAPLPVQRTVLKLFEIPEIDCSDISEVLLHDLPACKPQNENPVDCFPLLALDSKTTANLAQ
ncbi:hypothetical protein [Ruegeria conchae]|uniref:Uncharacterized protein n=1 Tax=Ruegeria conchae TaxID=981384 RepID=A0A497YR73_9RHOB|nr:hypothetical protein [Ruegeria conchae]RLJ98480.1 hypothetical protein CLV75_4180 [Ruegeria conchae]